MKQLRILPVVGMNTVQEDAALQRGGEAPSFHVRNARNVDITAAGKIKLRPGLRHLSGQRLKHLWHSSLHGDTFATLDGDWVRLQLPSGEHEPLATIGEGEISHLLLNNRVLVSGPAGVFAYDGRQAQRLTLDTPPAPRLETAEGALAPGRYSAAVAWVRGGLESPLSSAAELDLAHGGGCAITLPACFDPSVSHVRLYLSKPGSGELRHAEDYPAARTTVVAVARLPELGGVAPFRYCEPMPSGRFLRYWRGRLLTAKANVLRFSEALAYHIHDPRHGFVLLPQRITFVEPVDGGIWVGQVDHVAFLRGSEPTGLALERKTGRPPVPGSALVVPAQTAGEAAAGGGVSVVWLAENGYVSGTAEGQVVERSAGVLSGIVGTAAASVVVGDRLLTVVS